MENSFMVKNDFTQFLDTNFMKSVPSFTSFTLDFQDLMNTQRKNMEAFSESQRLAVESMQNVMQHQAQLLSKLIQDNIAIAQELMGEGTPEQKVVIQADMLAKNYESSMESIKEIGDLLSTSGQKSSEIINKRVSSSLNEVQEIIKRANQTSRKAA